MREKDKPAIATDCALDQIVDRTPGQNVWNKAERHSAPQDQCFVCSRRARCRDMTQIACSRSALCESMYDHMERRTEVITMSPRCRDTNSRLRASVSSMSAPKAVRSTHGRTYGNRSHVPRDGLRSTLPAVGAGDKIGASHAGC